MYSSSRAKEIKTRGVIGIPIGIMTEKAKISVVRDQKGCVSYATKTAILPGTVGRKMEEGKIKIIRIEIIKIGIRIVGVGIMTLIIVRGIRGIRIIIRMIIMRIIMVITEILIIMASRGTGISI